MARRGTKAVIPNKCNRILPFSFNKTVYRSRNKVERAFNRLKDFRRIFTRYLEAPTESLPEAWRANLDPLDEAARARRVCDFVAGMTDRFALQEHARLFGSPAELRP